jgi:hypothetical protein
MCTPPVWLFSCLTRVSCFVGLGAARTKWCRRLRDSWQSVFQTFLYLSVSIWGASRGVRARAGEDPLGCMHACLPRWPRCTPSAHPSVVPRYLRSTSGSFTALTLSSWSLISFFFLFCQRFALCDGVVLAVGSASPCPSTNVELCLLLDLACCGPLAALQPILPAVVPSRGCWRVK